MGQSPIDKIVADSYNQEEQALTIIEPNDNWIRVLRSRDWTSLRIIKLSKILITQTIVILMTLTLNF